jgi:hypothetical protein
MVIVVHIKHLTCSLLYTYALFNIGIHQLDGTGAAEQWGLWRDDPGPRGVFLKDYDRRLGANDNVAPAGMIYA